jgi:hypothetical protein
MQTMQTMPPTGTGGTGRLGSRTRLDRPGPGSLSPCITDAILREEFYGTGGSRTSCGTAGAARACCRRLRDRRRPPAGEGPYRFKPASGGEPVTALTLSIALTAAAVALAAVARAGTGCGRAG